MKKLTGPALFGEVPEHFTNMVSSSIREEKPVKKKSLSFVLISALMLVLFAASALAIANRIITRDNPDKIEALNTWMQDIRETIEDMDFEQANQVYIDAQEDLFNKVGDPLTWSLEERQCFDNFKVELFGKEQEFIHALPAEASISQEKAIEIAFKQAADVYSIEADILQTYYISVSFLESATNLSIWQIVLIEPSQNENKDFYDSTSYIIKIDASTGEVESIIDTPAING